MSAQIPGMVPGDRVRFWTPAGEARRWWTVRAGDERFTVLTRQAEFEPKGVSCYTIIDRKRDVRGPCNLIGQGWEVDEPGGPDALLRALQRHDEIGEILARDGSYSPGELEGDGPWWPEDVEVSYRNNVEVRIREIVEVSR